MKRRAALDADEEAWLRGDPNCGFVQFMPDDKLEALWESHGNQKRFEWRIGLVRPMLRNEV
jgi:hypothetical protein